MSFNTGQVTCRYVSPEHTLLQEIWNFPEHFLKQYRAEFPVQFPECVR